MSARQMLWLATLALIAGMLAVSCSSTMTPPSSPKTATPAQLAINRPIPAPVGADIPESLSTQSSPRVYTEKVNLDAFAPSGRGRDLTIMNCDRCHSWTCALEGQRTIGYWESIKYRHRVGSMVILSDHDWDTLFSYLEDNFNDAILNQHCHPHTAAYHAILIPYIREPGSFWRASEVAYESVLTFGVFRG